ncbi:MAG: hypothetical protein V5A43_07720 [Haloarculaceae archaeon]
MRLRSKYALGLLPIIVVLGGIVLGSTELFKHQAIDREEEQEDDPARRLPPQAVVR